MYTCMYIYICIYTYIQMAEMILCKYYEKKCTTCPLDSWSMMQVQCVAVFLQYVAGCVAVCPKGHMKLVECVAVCCSICCILCCSMCCSVCCRVSLKDPLDRWNMMQAECVAVCCSVLQYVLQSVLKRPVGLTEHGTCTPFGIFRSLLHFSFHIYMHLYVHIYLYIHI